MSEDDLARRREFLKDTVRKQTDFRTTDQSRGAAPAAAREARTSRRAPLQPAAPR